ncbi:MAG: hypothetical protein Q8P10_02335 [bacterium]|nr:hypothetical protein [bacterium]
MGSKLEVALGRVRGVFSPRRIEPKGALEPTTPRAKTDFSEGVCGNGLDLTSAARQGLVVQGDVLEVFEIETPDTEGGIYLYPSSANNEEDIGEHIVFVTDKVGDTTSGYRLFTNQETLWFKTDEHVDPEELDKLIRECDSHLDDGDFY